jgi:hypothetical protein
MYPKVRERGNERPARLSCGISTGSASTRSSPLPKRNYGFEKRQKEVRRQQKKEEKKQKKLERAKQAEPVSPEDGGAGEEQPQK